MLVVDRLVKHYGSVVALDDVSFGVERGEIVGFVGPNGAGKTTTMRAIMGLVATDAGTVTWDGATIDARTRQGFGYMPAERGMYPRMRVRDHLVYYANLTGLEGRAAVEVADRWLERLGLSERATSRVQELSSGNQQRVQLALSLIGDPELLVLDEPFSGLDPLAVETLRGVLEEQVDRGAALLLSSHQLDLVAGVCRSVVIVDHGRVVLRGEVAQLRAASATRYLDLEFVRATGWRPEGADGATVSDDGRRIRVPIDHPDAADRLVVAARATGELLSFSYSPPSLSEIFLEAVGRPYIEEPDGDAAERAR